MAKIQKQNKTALKGYTSQTGTTVFDGVMSFDDIFEHGIYKGCRVIDIIEEKFEYIVYLANAGFQEFDQEVLDALEG